MPGMGDRGRIGGPLVEASACSMKHPPQQMRDSDARQALEAWIHGASAEGVASTLGEAVEGVIHESHV